jgi:hypothetical protein
MVFDEARQRALLLLSGRAATWQWDGESWVQLADIGPLMSQPGMTYDAGRKSVLATEGGSTWEWDGTAWTQVADTGGGDGARLAYDIARGKVVSVSLGTNQSVDTWEWDGAAWTQIADTGPVSRSAHDVAYDRDRHVLVLFGGLIYAGAPLLGDTWTWDGNAWEQVADMGPSPRGNHRMVYDTERSRTVLFGGQVFTSAGLRSSLKDTWEWDGARWLQLQDIGPAARGGHAMAYDLARQRAVLFGGSDGTSAFGDTWKFAQYN